VAVTYHDAVDTAVEQSPAPATTADLPSGALALATRVGKGISVPFWICASRIIFGLIFAHLVIVLFPQARQHLIGATLNNGNWLGAFDRWDSAYYLAISSHGYTPFLVATDHVPVFFPGYPLLITFVRGLTFGTLSSLDAALAVSWIAFIAASVLLYRLAERRFGTRVALIATVLFCWVPISFFFMAPYSEALFACEIVLFLTFLERRWFLGAALVAAYASATSPESAALSIALMVTMLLARQGILRVAACGAISVAGITGYVLYLWAQLGHPFLFLTQQTFWKRTEHFPFVGLYRNVLALQHYVTGPGSPSPGGVYPTFTNIKWVWILDDAALVLASILVLWLGWLTVQRWRAHRAPTLALPTEKAPIPIAYVVVAFLIVGLATVTTIAPYAAPQWASSEGEARFVGVVMPLYVSGALAVRRWASLTSLAIGGFVVVTLVFQALFNLGYWIT
jgi:hypothetical protein